MGLFGAPPIQHCDVIGIPIDGIGKARHLGAGDP
jgi:hypothetical protein